MSKAKVFNALKGLGSQLQLSPIIEHIHISQRKEGCVKEGCCCSSPIEVQVSIPRDPTGGEAADLLNLAILDDYIGNIMPAQSGGVLCTGQLQECQQPISVERRKLLR